MSKFCKIFIILIFLLLPISSCQCTVRWVNGASGAPALNLVEPVASSGARRPAQGRSCSTRRPLANPALKALRSESAWSGGGNVQVKKTKKKT